MTDHVAIPVDEDGMPCVQTFIMALHDAVPQEMLDMLDEVPSQLPQALARRTDQLTLAWGFLADGIAATLIRCYGDPEQGMAAFVDMLRTLLAQRQVETENE
jgi:hypothetical protein